MVTLSVVMCVRATDAYAGEAVRAVLDSDLADLELILVGGGADTRSAAAAGDPRVRTLATPGAGLGAARNAGLRLASGRYVAVIDGEDLVERDHFSRAVAALERSGSDFCVCLGADAGADRARAERRAIVLEEFPAIAGITSPRSKVYLRSFIGLVGLRFTEKPQCEDPIPSALGYVAARRFDVLAHAAVRRRDADRDTSPDLDSEYVTDLAGVLEEASRLVESYGGSWLKEQWIVQTLGTLPLPGADASLPHLRRWQDLIAGLWDQVSPSAQANALGAVRRSVAYVASHGSLEQLAAFLAAGGADLRAYRFTEVDDDEGLIGSFVGGGRWLDLALDLPPWVRRAQAEELPASAVLDAVVWDEAAGALVLRGWCAVESLDAPDGSVQLRLDRLGGELRVPVPTRTLRSVAAPPAAYAPIGGWRFEARIDGSVLAAFGVRRWRLSRFALTAIVTTGAGTHHGPVATTVGVEDSVGVHDVTAGDASTRVVVRLEDRPDGVVARVRRKPLPVALVAPSAF